MKKKKNLLGITRMYTVFFQARGEKDVVMVSPLNVCLKNEEVGFESRFAWSTDGWSISG